MLIDAQYSPGTQKSPQQTEITQPCFTDTDKVHFPDGRLSTLPPYAVAVAVSNYVTLLGAIRHIHLQKIVGTYAGTYAILGSNTRLYALSNGTLFNITPFADQKAETLGTDPISVTSGDATVTLTWTAHGLSVGDSLTLQAADDVGGFTTLNDEHTVATVPNANTITFEMGSTASSTATGGGSSVVASAIGVAATLGANPISTVSGDATVTVTDTAHGLSAGDRIKLRDATATGGITAAALNVEHIVATVPDADSFTIEISAASSTATGGGSAIRVYKQITAGFEDQGSATGYGVGLYGEGLYGAGGAAVTAQTYPRIWSTSQFGNDMVLCPGDYTTGDGQKIYFWDGNTAKAPTVLANAPTNCNWVDVINNSVVALCDRQIRISELGDATVWTGLTALTSREQPVFKFIGTLGFNEKECLIYSPNRVYLATYVGGSDLWDLREIFNEDGIIAPNASCILNSKAYWRGNRGSYIFDGSPPRLLQNSQNDDWIIDNLNNGQAWKCFAYADPQNGEWYFHFPTGASNEPTDYVIHNITPMQTNPDGTWTLGLMNRTAAQRVPMIDSSFYMADADSASVAGTLFRHFGVGAVTFNWSATTSFAYVDKGRSRGMIKQILPDSNQSGNCTLNILTQEWPQGTITTSSNYTVEPTRKYVSTKQAGKLIAMKFSGSSQFTLGGWLMDLIIRGRR